MQEYSSLSHLGSRGQSQSKPEAHNGPGSGLGRAFSPASGQPGVQDVPPGMLPMPMDGGQHDGQDWNAVGSGAGTRSFGHSSLQQSSPHPEQPLPAPIEKRPSDLLHAFAQVTSTYECRLHDISGQHSHARQMPIAIFSLCPRAPVSSVRCCDCCFRA